MLFNVSPSRVFFLFVFGIFLSRERKPQINSFSSSILCNLIEKLSESDKRTVAVITRMRKKVQNAFAFTILRWKRADSERRNEKKK